jgi:hypothetical protein
VSQKWYQKVSNQAALVGGVFLLLTAIATGIFSIVKKSDNSKTDGSPKSLFEDPTKTFEPVEELCKIKIVEFKLNYSVNGKTWSSYINDTIKAAKGDTLLLIDFEIILSFNSSCKLTKITSEAFIKKPNIKNPDPKDKYDYNDGRFTEGETVTSVIKSKQFSAVSRSNEWILQSSWDNVVISLLEYSSQYPNGHVFDRIHFKIQK